MVQSENLCGFYGSMFITETIFPSQVDCNNKLEGIYWKVGQELFSFQIRNSNNQCIKCSEVVTMDSIKNLNKHLGKVLSLLKPTHRNLNLSRFYYTQVQNLDTVQPTFQTCLFKSGRKFNLKYKFTFGQSQVYITLFRTVFLVNRNSAHIN